MVWLFKGDKGILWRDNSPHIHLGSSEVGIRIEKIIEANMNREDVFGFEFILVKGLSVLKK